MTCLCEHTETDGKVDAGLSKGYTRAEDTKVSECRSTKAI